ncbi:MAG TPA: Mur ligase domain-containing protein [Candidatus Saccharimonadales bacterium]|nr:Mur ligase domain-containing protein [Candidatus Saccharimonadales bacterium]
MHIYFSGIGGAGIGPLALIAKQAGYDVSGSDAHDSSYIDYLKKKGISDIHIGQTEAGIAQVQANMPIDWFVYSSALPKTNPNHPELLFCRKRGIKATKRDEFLNQILADKDLKLIAVAGTHGKTTTTAMVVWLFKQMGRPVSYSVGAKTSFSDMGAYEADSEYFVYEADEYDRNFLSFKPRLSLITGIDWDHPDIYPSRDDYYQAFRDFINQSQHTFIWRADAQKLGLSEGQNVTLIDDNDPAIATIRLAGDVNRRDGWLASQIGSEVGQPAGDLAKFVSTFPGLSRRFEQIAPNVYSDYAHTPPKIRGALQLAKEVAGDRVVIIYEGLHNTRQHFIKDELANLFDEVKQLYIVPSYLAREDESLELLIPEKLLDLLSNQSKRHAEAAQLDDNLAKVIRQHANAGNLVLCLSAGGAGSLDEWLRRQFSNLKA